MKQNTIFSFLLIALMGTACGTSGNANEAQDHDHAAMEAPEQDEHTSADGSAVQLDNGKTWEANVETTEGVKSMQAIVAGFDPATGDGAVFKEELEAEFKDIFAKCTMTGEAHDQLHNYLIPIHKMLDKLSPEPSAAELAELGDYLKTYPNYFH
ncbi:MAG: hypothetical protein WBB32_13180 [Flavobacteriales bacterium]|nr:hypothetical protein [Flavobacteriales bacterium]